MGEVTLPLATVLVAAALVVLATLTAALDAALNSVPTRGRGGGSAARRRGAALGLPVVQTARLLRQRRRTTIAADRLLWRVGLIGLPVVALLMAALVPVAVEFVAGQVGADGEDPLGRWRFAGA